MLVVFLTPKPGIGPAFGSSGMIKQTRSSRTNSPGLQDLGADLFSGPKRPPKHPELVHRSDLTNLVASKRNSFPPPNPGAQEQSAGRDMHFHRCCADFTCDGQVWPSIGTGRRCFWDARRNHRADRQSPAACRSPPPLPPTQMNVNTHT